MNYIKALVIKFLMTFGVLFIFLSLMFNMALIHVIAVSAIITVLGFVLGDLFILPSFENWGATLTDFFLVVIAIQVYGMNFFTGNLPTLGTIGFIALIISAGEFFYHIYIDHNILNVIEEKDPIKDEDIAYLQTEFSEEFDEENYDE